jgi:hypothetical protein
MFPDTTRRAYGGAGPSDRRPDLYKRVTSSFACSRRVTMIPGGMVTVSSFRFDQTRPIGCGSEIGSPSSTRCFGVSGPVDRTGARQTFWFRVPTAPPHASVRAIAFHLLSGDRTSSVPMISQGRSSQPQRLNTTPPTSQPMTGIKSAIVNAAKVATNHSHLWLRVGMDQPQGPPKPTLSLSGAIAASAFSIVLALQSTKRSSCSVGINPVACSLADSPI